MILTDKILPQPNGVVNQFFLHFVDKKSGHFLYNPYKERKNRKKSKKGEPFEYLGAGKKSVRRPKIVRIAHLTDID